MNVSTSAWNQTLGIVDAIHHHPFNQELAIGTLSQERFAYYIEQDVFYLQEFSKCHAILAARAPLKYIETFLNYSRYTLISEQELVHVYFKNKFNLTQTEHVTPATLGYTSYMLNQCSNQPFEVGLASVLPCFWVYREVGCLIAKHSHQKNPYQRWIDAYSSPEFAASVESAISIFDEVGKKASKSIQEEMCKAFYLSTVWEWHFWHDAYQLKNFSLTSVSG